MLNNTVKAAWRCCQQSVAATLTTKEIGNHFSEVSPIQIEIEHNLISSLILEYRLQKLADIICQPFTVIIFLGKPKSKYFLIFCWISKLPCNSLLPWQLVFSLEILRNRRTWRKKIDNIKSRRRHTLYHISDRTTYLEISKGILDNVQK